MRSFFLAAILLAGCAREASWTVRDGNGWPVPTWARMGGEPRLAGDCGLAHGALVSPDSLGSRQEQLARTCGYHVPGWRGREELRQTRVQRAAR